MNKEEVIKLQKKQRWSKNHDFSSKYKGYRKDLKEINFKYKKNKISRIDYERTLSSYEEADYNTFNYYDYLEIKNPILKSKAIELAKKIWL